MIKATDVSKNSKIWKVSNPYLSQTNTQKYLGNNTILFISDRKNKKYMVYNPKNNRMVHFGDIRYEDFTRHKSSSRRNNYLSRARAIEGNWKNDRYSANNLSINILWN
jgi:hypothetical protein